MCPKGCSVMDGVEAQVAECWGLLWCFVLRLANFRLWIALQSCLRLFSSSPSGRTSSNWSRENCWKSSWQWQPFWVVTYMLLPRKVLKGRSLRAAFASHLCSQLPTPSFCSQTGGANAGIPGLFLFLSRASTLATRQPGAKNIEWKLEGDGGRR